MNEQKCASCTHPMGEHFQRYDGKSGCAHVTPASGTNQLNYEDAKACNCSGYAVLYRVPPGSMPSGNSLQFRDDPIDHDRRGG